MGVYNKSSHSSDRDLSTLTPIPPGDSLAEKMASPKNLTRYAILSIFAAVLTIGLKSGAWLLTNSVGLLSDAAESLINLATALATFLALRVAAQPPDEDHAFGHYKVEYLATGFQGALILIAALGVGVSAAERLMNPAELTEMDFGLALGAGAAMVNAVVGLTLKKVGRQVRSVSLEGEGEHLMTDVWTSVGVLIGVGIAAFTGYQWLDPLCALAVAAHITRSGIGLLKNSARGLLDTVLPQEEMDALRGVLDGYKEKHGVDFHALRTRASGPHAFVSLHLLVPGAWTVQEAHDFVELVEADLRRALPGSSIFTHVEPMEDPASFEDIKLHR